MRILQDRYAIVGLVGKGGHGAVHLCEDRRLHSRLWAVKEMPFQDPAARAEFEREAALLSQLDHPRIPVLVDFFIQDECGYLVREYLDGPTLHKWIEKSGPVGEAQALHWGVQLAEVLVYLHQRKPPLYHRDLKPQNLIILNDGIRLIDFGLAREDQGEPLTQQAGSMSFTAPEQLGSIHHLEPSADIYSLGAILYYALRGLPPGPTGGEHRLRTHRPDLEPRTEQIILQCLESDPAARPGNVSQVLHSLQYQAARFPLPDSTPPAFTPPPRTRAKAETPRTTRWAMAGALMPLLVLLAVATGLALSNSRPSKPHPTDSPHVQGSHRDDSIIAWPIIQAYVKEKHWPEAEGALRATLAAQPGSGWARLLLNQMEMIKAGSPRVPLLLPLGGQEEEHVNWILQGFALGQQDEKRFLFDLVDTHTTPALQAFQSLREPSLVLGPFGTQEALMLSPLVGKVPLLPIGSTDPRVREAGPTVYPVGFPHADRIAALLHYALSKAGPHGIILYAGDTKAMLTSAQFAEEKVKADSGKATLMAFNPEDDPVGLVSRISSERPDWVYLSDNHHERAARWVSRLRLAGVMAPVICVFHPASENFVGELDEITGQVWMVEPLWQTRNHDFVQRCRREFSTTEVDWNTALGYDAARLASLAWKTGPAANLRESLESLPPFEGLLGRYDLARKEFQPHAFRYRMVYVEKGRRQSGPEL